MKKPKQNKLAFNKAVVTELNLMQLKNVNGGTGIRGYDDETNPCSGCVCDPITVKMTINQLNQL
ncbi:class I lanthipeptide [Flavobacterium hydatis]|uniref:Uncharacterized protein n=1 Tax=Flavobacterium hydatis TaxID=991 RepID=A0A086AIB9_FLAHY|nr:class I lanthipeptide [Flavobacterium hydatis]KFF16433.1 hypothetical protein IW20_11860 [Flavobacterium hydatis]OXA96550.1 hypothetical protein B0A62_04620 [Flavobacterium hydatis]